MFETHTDIVSLVHILPEGFPADNELVIKSFQITTYQNHEREPHKTDPDDVADCRVAAGRHHADRVWNQQDEMRQYGFSEMAKVFAELTWHKPNTQTLRYCIVLYKRKQLLIRVSKA